MNLPTFAPLFKFWCMAGLSLGILAGCATAPQAPSATSPAKAEAPAEPVISPAELALAQGLKAYQAAQYAESEAQLKQALQLGLGLGSDRANAHKHLAFIYCTSKRETLCASAFKAARQADPSFALSKSEAGHPMWGRVYRKALPTP
jgi:Tfp pilus assembly protein PilF